MWRRLIGKEQRKTSAALTGLHAAANSDRPSQPAYDPIRHPQAEAGPLLSFGSEEWLEDTDKVVLRNSDTAIRNGYPNTIARRTVPMLRFANTYRDRSPRQERLPPR